MVWNFDLPTVPWLRQAARNWEPLLSKMEKNDGQEHFGQQVVFMIVEQIVNELGRLARGSCLSSAYVWTSSNVFLPILSSSDKLDSQKAWLTTFFASTEFPFDFVIADNRILTHKISKSCFILVISSSSSFLTPWAGMSHCWHLTVVSISHFCHPPLRCRPC